MRLSLSGPRAYIPDYVYIAGSLWGHAIKIGVTKHPRRRQNDLRREKYGGLSDWRILYFVRARYAYILESEALYRLRLYERPDYEGAEEIVLCSFTQALEAVSDLITEEAQASAWWASNWPIIAGFAEMPHVPSRVADHRTYIGIYSIDCVNKKVTLQMALAAIHRKSLR